MNNIPITIADPGLDWTGLYIGLGIAGAALAVALFLPLVIRLFTPHWDGDDIGTTWMFCLTVAIIAGFVGTGVSSNSYTDEYREYKIAAIEDAGFSNVDKAKDDTFIASVDGVYFEGGLLPNGKDSWLIVETGK